MKKVTVLSNQSLFDIAIQYYGTIDGIFTICMANNITITDKLLPGQVLNIPEFKGNDSDIVDYYKEHDIKPATTVLEVIENTQGGINYWDIGNFEIS